MANLKYLLGLVLIMLVVWLTMILCLMVVYFLLPSMEPSSLVYITELAKAVIMLLVAGSVLFVWLYSWNLLVKLYFQRNLSQSEMKRKRPSARRRRENTKVSHIPRKSIS